VRERVFAHYFGNDSIPADAFRAALRIPNTIRSLLGEGTLLGSFIPVYAALNERANKGGARALAGAVLGLLLLGSGVLALLGIAFAPSPPSSRRASTSRAGSSPSTSCGSCFR